MNDEQLLRDRLNEVVVPPLELGMDRVVAGGVRKLRRRRAATVTAAAVLSAGVLAAVPALLPGDRNTGNPAPADRGPATTAPSPTPAALSCEVTGELEKPANAGDLTIDATDPTGRYVVGNGSSGQNFIPFYWADGKVQRVPYPEASAEMIDVNSAGVALGRGSDGGAGTDTFFRYAAGELTELKMPSGEWTTLGWPQLNSAGEVLATVEPKGNYEGRGAVVLLWAGDSTEAEQLPLPSNADSDIIADNGTIAGVLRNRAGQQGYDTERMQALPAGTADDGTLAYVWDRTGKGRALETPSGYSSAAYSISSDGAWATGGLWNDDPDAGGDPETGLWNVATGELVTKLANNEVGHAVNINGLVRTLGGALYHDGEQLVLDTRDTKAGAVTDTNRVIDQKLRTWQC